MKKRTKIYRKKISTHSGLWFLCSNVLFYVSFFTFFIFFFYFVAFTAATVADDAAKERTMVKCRKSHSISTAFSHSLRQIAEKEKKQNKIYGKRGKFANMKTRLFEYFSVERIKQYHTANGRYVIANTLLDKRFTIKRICTSVFFIPTIV